MTSHSFTPGPWRAEGDDVFSGHTCQATHIANANPIKDMFQSTAHANARLIAAAPDMFAALLAHEAAQAALNEAEEHSECAEAEGWRNDPTGSCWVSESYNRANKMFEVAAELRRAAISKAEGR